jgi:hypothetical protein
MRKKYYIRTLTVCLAIVIFCFNTQAQIVYTDIKPDLSLKCTKQDCSKIYSLDLNNDGITDFNIIAHIDASSPMRGIYITPLNGDSVLVAPGIISVNAPWALAENDVIGSTSAIWSNSPYSFPGPPYMYLRGYPNTGQSYDCCFVGSSYGYVGLWPNQSDHYLGLKLIINGQIYYGWARLSVSVISNKWATSFTIKDYAYQTTPGQSINAGDKGTGLSVKSSAETIQKEKTDPTELKVAPNPISASTTISFTLDKTEKIFLGIYDINGKLISTIVDHEFSAMINNVKWNAINVKPGIYILRLQSPSVVQTKKLIVIK